jgi:hypothetical protein
MVIAAGIAEFDEPTGYRTQVGIGIVQAGLASF